MTIQEYFHQLRLQLQPLYHEKEASLMAEMLIEHVTGFNRSQRIVNNTIQLTEPQLTLLDLKSEELQRSVPIQYILEQAWFMNNPYFVNPHVLIPRPETEELVEWCLDTIEENEKLQPFNRLLDIGTGSGCIPISIKQCYENIEVHALDVSSDALAVAKKNAEQLKQNLVWHELDIRDKSNWSNFPVFDIILSNPPYIPEKELATLSPHVASQEPHLALFVPNDDPLIFYRTIAEFAKTHLRAGGFLFFEIHADAGHAAVKLLRSYGFNTVSLRKDMQGMHRMIKVTK